MLKVYDEYKKYGIAEYYKNYSKDYYNPHHVQIKDIYLKYILNLISRNDNILDIACGDGLITRLINTYSHNYNIDGLDPYFDNIYTKFHYSFEDIAKGALNNIEKKYNIGICCYAFHLINESWKYDFLSNLSLKISKFIIITPSKKIKIKHPLWKITNEIRDNKITVIILETFS
jgi:hypothetical protein